VDHHGGQEQCCHEPDRPDRRKSVDTLSRDGRRRGRGRRDRPYDGGHKTSLSPDRETGAGAVNAALLLSGLLAVLGRRHQLRTGVERRPGSWVASAEGRV